MVKKLTANIFLLVFSLSATFLVLEIGLRFYQLAMYGTPILSASQHGLWQRAQLDSELGWKNTENYAMTSTLQDASGNTYLAKVSSGKYGFKLFGNNTAKPKVFIVGDSFTDANQVSNDKTYWAVLADNFKNRQFYVYGSGGYGNLQEFMIIDKYLDEIKPDVLLLQFSTNDFINNDYNLEAASYRSNNGMTRPYLTSSGKIFYENPRHLKILPEFLINHSRLFFILNYKMQVFFYVWKDNATVEKEIQTMGSRHEGFRQAAALTKIILQKIRERAPGVKIFAFCVDYEQPYYDEFKEIAKSLGIEFIDGIPQAVKTAEDSGHETRAADKGHWNELGNKIAGEKLSEYFLTHGFD